MKRLSWITWLRGAAVAASALTTTIVSAGHSIPHADPWNGLGYSGNCWTHPVDPQNCLQWFYDHYGDPPPKNQPLPIKVWVNGGTDYYAVALQNARENWDAGSDHLTVASTSGGAGSSVEVIYTTAGERMPDGSYMGSLTYAITFRCRWILAEVCSQSGIVNPSVPQWNEIWLNRSSTAMGGLDVNRRTHVIAHEIGHTLGLNHHCTESTQTQTLMLTRAICPTGWPQMPKAGDWGPTSPPDACPNPDPTRRGVTCIFRWSTQN